MAEGDAPGAAPSSPPSVTLGEQVQRLLSVAFWCAPVGMALVTEVGVMVQVNGALAELLGEPVERLVGRRLQELADSEQAQALSAGWRRMVEQGVRRQVSEGWLRRADGQPVPVSLTCALLPDPGGEPGGESGVRVVVQVLDLTDRRAAEAELIHRAVHDPLTGLPNRVLLLDRLTLALARLPRRPSTVAVLFCDLNGFKQINDRYGHEAGDQVLIEVARRLRSVQRPGDTACRLGGDEFVVLCTDSGRVEADSVARRIHAALAAAPIQLLPAGPADGPGRKAAGPVTVTVTASIGIATTSEATTTAEQLLHAADLVMYRTKTQRAGPNSAAPVPDRPVVPAVTRPAENPPGQPGRGAGPPDLEAVPVTAGQCRGGWEPPRAAVALTVANSAGGVRSHRGQLHVRLEQRQPALAPLLDRVHRQIRRAQQALCVSAGVSTPSPTTRVR